MTIVLIVLVVVAAVILPPVLLYFMVLGFPGGTDGGFTPAATYMKNSVTGGYRIVIISITKADVSWDDVSVQITDSANFATWDPKSRDLDSGSAATADYGSMNLGAISIEMSVTDVSGNGYVSGSDYFVLKASPAFDIGTSYSAYLLYMPTGERIGTGITFTG